MGQIKWFERKFDFSNDQNIFPSILERLAGTPVILEHKINTIPTDQLTVKHQGEWSIQENIGHLIDLEPLWQGRLQEILDGKEYLRSADLENTKTHLANHNDESAIGLLTQFRVLRNLTLEKLRPLKEVDTYKTALHPRLKQPMSIHDLFLFVAEHDDHHLARMSELCQLHG